MTRPLIFAALIAVATPALAQAPAAPAPAPPAPRARGPGLELSVEASRQAVATCTANGYKTTALVVDSGGVPVVLLSSDGASARTVDVAGTKVAAALKYKMDSGQVVERAKTDAAMAKEIAADPKIGQARQGAVLIKVGGEIVGAMAVSGAPGGDKDEACVRAGLDKVASRLKQSCLPSPSMGEGPGMGAKPEGLAPAKSGLQSKGWKRPRRWRAATPIPALPPQGGKVGSGLTAAS